MQAVFWPLLFLLVTMSVLEAQLITFPRCNTDSLILEFVYANPRLDPYDLFAVSRRSTCGKRAGTIAGNGSYENPYIISVSLSGGLTAQTPDCGVVQTGPKTFRLLVKTTFSCEDGTDNDSDYTVECEFNLPNTSSGGPVSSRSGNYTCQSPATILFTYSQTSSRPPADIYAEGKELTCSLSTNRGTGRGLNDDPYVLEIDVRDPANVCGVTLTGVDTYSLVMYVQQFPDIVTSADVSYVLTCNYTSLVNQLISSATLPANNSNLPVNEARQNQPSASLFIVSSSSPTTVLTSFAVGDPIRLVAQLLAGPATGLRVRQCTASPGPAVKPQLSIVDDSGCSNGDNLVPPFIGQGPSGSKAMTDSFEAFKFRNHDTVFFQCVADFCYVASDLACLGTHCQVNSRKKREAGAVSNTTVTTGVISAYVLVRSNVSANNTGSSETSPQQDNSCPWPQNYVVVVASLASVSTLLLMLLVAVVVRLVIVTSSHRHNRPERETYPANADVNAVSGLPCYTSRKDGTQK